jgi:hypothetical protein
MAKAHKSVKVPEYKPEKIGEFIFEVVQVRALKVGENGVYGDPYTSIAMINIIDGNAHVNSTIGTFSRKCFRTIFNYIKTKGIKIINYKRIKNLKDKHKTVSR